jgi:hypothetical protein
VDRFIARANIVHFEDLLARETDPERQLVIERLLALERQKLRIAERQDRKEARQPSTPGRAMNLTIDMAALAQSRPGRRVPPPPPTHPWVSQEP